jgi:Protein of unknown function (DUF1360)
MHFYWLTLGVLVVWRITHFFNAEDGPFNVGVRLRRMAGESVLGDILDCFYCLSVWIAIPFALWIGSSWKEITLLWLAFSSGAISLERLTTRTEHDSPTLAWEKETENELLRKATIELER